MHVGYWWESQKERECHEDQDMGGWIMDQDRDQWREIFCTHGSFSIRTQPHEVMLEVQLLAPCPTSSLDNQGLPFVWPLLFDLSSFGNSTRNLCTH
jgi:hypothetical protein